MEGTAARNNWLKAGSSRKMASLSASDTWSFPPPVSWCLLAAATNRKGAKSMECASGRGVCCAISREWISMNFSGVMTAVWLTKNLTCPPKAQQQKTWSDKSSSNFILYCLPNCSESHANMIAPKKKHINAGEALILFAELWCVDHGDDWLQLWVYGCLSFFSLISRSYLFGVLHRFPCGPLTIDHQKWKNMEKSMQNPKTECVLCTCCWAREVPDRSWRGRTWTWWEWEKNSELSKEPSKYQATWTLAFSLACMSSENSRSCDHFCSSVNSITGFPLKAGPDSRTSARSKPGFFFVSSNSMPPSKWIAVSSPAFARCTKRVAVRNSVPGALRKQAVQLQMTASPKVSAMALFVDGFCWTKEHVGIAKLGIWQVKSLEIKKNHNWQGCSILFLE